jgi:hypothetical protein
VVIKRCRKLENGTSVVEDRASRKTLTLAASLPL